MSAADVWAFVAALVGAYLVVIAGGALVVSWSWWRNRRAVRLIARHRWDRSGAADIVAGGVS